MIYLLIGDFVDLENQWGIRIESTLVVRRVKVSGVPRGSGHGWN